MDNMTGIKEWREQAKEAKIARAEQDALQILARNGTGPLQCDCCGFVGLQRARLIGDRLLGPECSQPDHSFPCQKFRKQAS